MASCATSTPAGRPSTATPSPPCATGGDPGDHAGMAPVHDRAAALALGPHVSSWAVASGSCRCGSPPRATGDGRRPPPGRRDCSPRSSPRSAAGHDPGRGRPRVPLATAAARHRPRRPPARAPPARRRRRVLAETLRLARRRAVVAVPFEDEADQAWGHVRTFDSTTCDALGAAPACPTTSTRTTAAGWSSTPETPETPDDERAADQRDQHRARRRQRCRAQRRLVEPVQQLGRRRGRVRQ